MPETEGVDLAIECSISQAALLREDAIDPFLAGESRYLALCRAAIADATDDDPRIHELAACHVALLLELQRAMDRVSARITDLGQNRRATSAYLAGGGAGSVRATG